MTHDVVAFGSIRRITAIAISLLLVTAGGAFGGTVSPQLAAMPPGQPVQVIVQYSSSLIGSLLSTVCGTLNLVQLLPGGELCSMTVSAAIGLGQNPSVAHISVNNALQGMTPAVPVYDFVPQTVQPVSQSASTTGGTANMNMGASAWLSLTVVSM
jgi:hypothetical protein